MADLLDRLKNAAQGMRANGYYAGADFLNLAIAEIERLRAAPARADVGAGWQPIETAPRDGTHVLLWASDYADRPGIGAWCKAVCAWDADIGMMDDGPAVLPDEASGPTHWMPVQPPATQIRGALAVLEHEGFVMRQPVPGSPYRRTAAGLRRRPVQWQIGAVFAVLFAAVNKAVLARRAKAERRPLARNQTPAKTVLSGEQKFAGLDPKLAASLRDLEAGMLRRHSGAA